jgi:flagellar hook-associated protein 2
MATSTVSTGTSVLNVPNLVSSLMQVETVPLTKLDAQIKAVNTSVSALGGFRSKVTALQTALGALASADSFSTRATSSTNSTLLSATATTTALVGDLDVSVTQSAKRQQSLLTNADFTSTSALVGSGSLSIVTSNNVTGLSISTSSSDTLATLAAAVNIQGQQSVLTSTSFTSATSYVGAGSLIIGDNTISTSASTDTLSSLATSINADSSTYGVTAAVKQQNDGTWGLELTSTTSGGTFTAPTAIGAYTPTVVSTTAYVYGVTAAVVQQDAGVYGLMLTSTATGTANTFTVPTTVGSSTVASKTLAATDAALTVNGVAYTRGSNTFSSVLSGLTLNINEAVGSTTSTAITAAGVTTTATVASSVTSDSARITVAAQNSAAATAVQSMVTAYNDVITENQTLTKSSTDAATRGTLAGDTALPAFMTMVKTLFDAGAYDSAGTNVLWSTAGVSFQRNGTLSIDSTKLSTALSGDLGTILASGLLFGTTSSTTDLVARIYTENGGSGLLSTGQTGATSTLRLLNDKRAKLSTRLDLAQAAYTKKYAALDAMLTKMQQVSQDLAGSLDALSAQTK